MSIEPGLNMEFVRRSGKAVCGWTGVGGPNGLQVRRADAAHRHELMSEAGYYHSISMEEEPYYIKDLLDKHGLKASAVSAHCPLMRPEVSVVYLLRAIGLAAILGAPVVNTDESSYGEDIRPTLAPGPNRLEAFAGQATCAQRAGTGARVAEVFK